MLPRKIGRERACVENLSGYPHASFESVVRRLLIPSVCLVARQTGVSSVRGRRLYMEDECRMLTCMENAAPADHHQTGRGNGRTPHDQFNCLKVTYVMCLQSMRS